MIIPDDVSSKKGIKFKIFYELHLKMKDMNVVDINVRCCGYSTSAYGKQ